MSVNKAIIVGNLGGDPETNEWNGIQFCNFSVATNEKWKDKQSGEMKEDTQWHRISTSGYLAENCGKYLSKGREVYVEGKIVHKEVEKDGEKKYFTEIKAMKVDFLGGGSKSEGGSSEAGSGVQSSGGDADVPF